ncbi:FdtA/QdtA family cupin domain-containing protein [bacterium]|jgi:mannose-6-phosphate isomerase-like protein (cupin superfamily)|nr:FdtA/QdtA family cupin domain-containing protein [bacterium]
MSQIILDDPIVLRSNRLGSVAPAPEVDETPSPIDLVRLVDLPRIEDRRGNLTFIEGCRHIPFDIRRVYYLYDVPGGADRGAHAHKQLEQLFIAMSGSFDVHLDDGRKKKTFHLNRSYYGLYIPSMVWRYLDNFSSGSVCLVLASQPFSEGDYFRQYGDFLAAVRSNDTTNR